MNKFNYYDPKNITPFSNKFFFIFIYIYKINKFIKIIIL